MPVDQPIAIFEDGSPEHRRDVDALEGLGVSIPECWRPRAPGTQIPAFRKVWVRQVISGSPLGFSLSMSRSRRVPWARIARLEQVGDPYFAAHAARFAKLLKNAVRNVGAVMRVEVRVLHRESSVRQALITAMHSEGGVLSRTPSYYRHTHLLDVTCSAAEMFGRLPSVARRRIRQPINRGLLLRENAVRNDDVGRLLELMHSAFSRTSGGFDRARSERDILASIREPAHRPLFTLEDAERSDSNRIVSFALGADNGDHVTYTHGASERSAGLGGLPLGYAPIWAMAEWGIRRGVRWIDLGGISLAEGENVALSGITSFKRQFGGVDAQVADEVTLVMRPSSVSVERLIGRWTSSRR
jgi:hypothetical protein